MNKNIPNILTTIRIPLSLIGLYFTFQKDFTSAIIAFSIFVIACLTDFLDGFLARKFNLISDYGKLMDPIADKVLTLGCFFVFSISNIIPFWAFVVIAFRELLLTVVRLIVAKNKVLAAGKSGKLKTVSQMIFIITIYLINIAIYSNKISSLQTLKIFNATLAIMLFWTVMITLWSGAEFFIVNDFSKRKTK